MLECEERKLTIDAIHLKIPERGAAAGEAFAKKYGIDPKVKDGE